MFGPEALRVFGDWRPTTLSSSPSIHPVRRLETEGVIWPAVKGVSRRFGAYRQLFEAVLEAAGAQRQTTGEPRIHMPRPGEDVKVDSDLDEGEAEKKWEREIAAAEAAAEKKQLQLFWMWAFTRKFWAEIGFTYASDSAAFLPTHVMVDDGMENLPGMLDQAFQKVRAPTTQTTGSFGPTIAILPPTRTKGTVSRRGFGIDIPSSDIPSSDVRRSEVALDSAIGSTPIADLTVPTRASSHMHAHRMDLNYPI
jgi:hypothetical protein